MRVVVLTRREIEVMWLVAEGLSNKLIADRINLSPHTVKFHVNSAMRKLDTTTRTRAAVEFALSADPVARQRFIRCIISETSTKAIGDQQ